MAMKAFDRDEDRLALCCKKFPQNIHVKQVALESVMLSCKEHSFLALKKKTKKHNPRLILTGGDSKALQLQGLQKGKTLSHRRVFSGQNLSILYLMFSALLQCRVRVLQAELIRHWWLHGEVPTTARSDM